jgi:NADH:ubiquinone oxidoreductase subunit H
MPKRAWRVHSRSTGSHRLPEGLFQPIADMFKLLLKEDFTPEREHLLLLLLRHVWR